MKGPKLKTETILWEKTTMCTTWAQRMVKNVAEDSKIHGGRRLG